MSDETWPHRCCWVSGGGNGANCNVSAILTMPSKLTLKRAHTCHLYCCGCCQVNTLCLSCCPLSASTTGRCKMHTWQQGIPKSVLHCRESLKASHQGTSPAHPAPNNNLTWSAMSGSVPAHTTVGLQQLFVINTKRNTTANTRVVPWINSPAQATNSSMSVRSGHAHRQVRVTGTMGSRSIL